MARRGWQEALANALQKEENPLMQLATIEAPNRPRVRTLGVHRNLITASTLPALPLLLAVTDVRTPKVEQLAANDVVEAVIWAPSTQEQFRVLGRASIVPELGYSGAYPARKGAVYDALDEEGFHWEAKRVELFDATSGRVRASWCRRQTPGTPLVGRRGGAEPATLPKLGETNMEDAEERERLARALANCALLVIEPFEVDYWERGPTPSRRTRFERVGSGEFRETEVAS